MMRYSVQPLHIMFVKGYGFLAFAKNMGKNRKNISKNSRSKYVQKLLHEAKQSAADAIKTLQKESFKKTVEATGDLIGNKIANRITKVSKNSETVTNEHDKNT